MAPSLQYRNTTHTRTVKPTEREPEPERETFSTLEKATAGRSHRTKVHLHDWKTISPTVGARNIFNKVWVQYSMWPGTFCSLARAAFLS